MLGAFAISEAPEIGYDFTGRGFHGSDLTGRGFRGSEPQGISIITLASYESMIREIVIREIRVL